MKLTALQLSQAGFSADTVKSYVDSQVPLLEKAGFSKNEIYQSYGVTQLNPAITDTDMQGDTTAINNQHIEMGKISSVMKKNQSDIENKVAESNVTSDGEYKIKNLTIDKLTSDSQKDITNKISEAYKLFKTDDNGRVGHVSNYMETHYPNVIYDKKALLNNEDLSVAENVLNEDQQALMEGVEAQDILGGNIGYNKDQKRYVFDDGFEKAVEQTEQKLKSAKKAKKYKILNTPNSTGEKSKSILSFASNKFGWNKLQEMHINEFVSFISALESNNRNINNQNSTAAGYFQHTKENFRTALNRYKNIKRKIDKNYQVEKWVTRAYQHEDVTRLSDDEQRAITIAHYLEMPSSTKYNRAGSDEYLKLIADGDVDAMKEFYIQHHHADYEKVEDIQAGDGQEYKLRDNQALRDRTNEYFDLWGTTDYDYETGQMAFFGNETNVVKAIEKIPLVGDKVIDALGGKGYYNVFTNGYEQSVNGLMDRFFQIMIDDPDGDMADAIKRNFMYQEQSFAKEVIQSVVTVVNDLPFMAAGCFAASGGAVASSGGMAIPAVPVVCGAGGFALPEVLRSAYMRAIEDNFSGTFSEFLSSYMDKKTAMVANKTALTGGVSMGAGSMVQKATGSVIKRLATETAIMTELGARLDNHVPTLRDFAHAGVLIFGMHGATRGIQNLKDIYTRFSIHPKDLIVMAEKDTSIRLQIEKGEIPIEFTEGAKTVIQKLETQSNIKLLPPPKFKNNEIVNITTSGTEVGKIVNKEVINGQVVLIVEKPNGAKIPILESEARKAPTTKIEIKIEGDKILINPKKNESFKEQKEQGLYNQDIIEVTKNANNIFTEGTFKSTPDTVIRETGTGKKIITQDGKTIANETITIQSKFYPKLKAEFKNSVEQKSNFKDANDIIKQRYVKLSSKNKKAEILYAVDSGGKSGFKFPRMVLRIGDENVAIPRSAYENLIRFEEKGQIKTAEIMGSDTTQPILFLHPETNKILATIKPEKLNGVIEGQANNYFHTLKDKEGLHFDRVNSSRDGDNWGIPRDIFVEANKLLPVDNSSNASAWKGLFNSSKGLDMIDLVELYKVFVNKSPELKNLPEGLNGYFQFKGKKAPRIVINEALQKNPEQFMMTFAHELGHLIDYLPNATLKRGNILGSIAALKGYMNKWIDGKNEGFKPFSAKEIEAMKKESIKEAKKNENKTDTEIKQLEITPDSILKIFNDAAARDKINPDFYNAFVKLDGAIKKLVVKDAMKGLMSPHLKAIADKINGKPTDARLTEEAYKIFKKRFEKELKERNLVNKEWITTELKNLSMRWKPFDRNARADYTAYRDGPRELMADFMMAFMLRPQWVKNNAPKTWEMWMYHMEARPEVKANWSRLQDQLKSGPDARLGEVITKIGDMFRETNKEIDNSIQKSWKENKIDQARLEAIDHYSWLYRRFKGTGNDRWHSPLAKEVNWSVENYRYRHAALKRYADDMQRLVIKPALEKGYDNIDIGRMLMLKNLAESTQRKDMVSSLGIMKADPKLAEMLGNRTSKELYDYLAKLHPDLVHIANDFYKVRQDLVIPELKKSGMYDAEFMANIENNIWYVTNNVKDYLIKRLEKYGENAIATRSVKASKGTFKNIQNVLDATIEKDMLLIVEARRHRTMALTVQYLKQNKSWMERFAKKKGEPSDKIIYKPKYLGKGRFETPEKGMETFSYLKNGKLELYHVNKYVTEGFKEMHDYNLMLKFMSGTGDLFRKGFTEYNVPFWPVNLSRDLNRSVKLLPNARYFDIAGKGKHSLVKYYIKAIKPAYKSLFKEGTELTRWMETEGFLISSLEGFKGQAGGKAYRKGMDQDTYMLEKLLGEIKKKEGFDLFYEKTFGDLFKRFQLSARMFERIPKIGGTMYLKDMVKRGEISMSDKEMMIRIQSEVGSPNFLRTGQMHPLLNNMFLYSNAFKEGWRADYTRTKEAPASVISKFIAYNAMPKVLQKSLELGIGGATLGYAYKYGVSEWDKVNYIPIVLGETPDGRIIYLRIPQDETSRLINGILYKIMGTGDEEGSVLETPADMFGYLGSSGLPSMNPTFKLISDLWGELNGTTPYDDFRNTKAVDATVDKADDARRTKDLLKWFFNTYSGQGFYKFESNDEKQIMTDLEKIFGTPIVGRVLNRFIKIGDNPAVGYIKEGVKVWEKEQARIKLDYDEGIINLLNGKELNDKQIFALSVRAENIKSNSVLIAALASQAGATTLLQEFIHEDDPRKLAIMMQRLIEISQKTDNEYPINFIKKEKSDKIEE